MAFTDLLATADKAVRKHLGSVVTYTPGVGVAVDVNGIFDATYVRVEVGTPGVSTSGPAVFLRLSDLPSDPYLDPDLRVTVGGDTYACHEAAPDGVRGGVVLHLHLVT